MAATNGSTNGHILSIDEILNASDVKEDTVSIPEWGGSVRIRGFTKGEAIRIRQEATLKADTRAGKKGEIDQGYLEMLMFVGGVIEPKFETKHILALQQKSAVPFARVISALNKLSGITEEAIRETEAAFPEQSRVEV